jgi:hypothetical protein
MCRMREPKKMALEVPERFLVMQLLPEKANFTNMKLIRELKEALVLTPDEQDAIEFVVQDDGTANWKGEKAAECIAEIPFDPKMYVVVMEALQKLDKDEELEGKHFSLYEKFVEVKVDDDAEKVVGKVD